MGDCLDETLFVGHRRNHTDHHTCRLHERRRSGWRFGSSYQAHPTAVQGQWFDTSGVAFSNFNNGAFETRANDTKEKLAEGNYRFASASLIEIDLRSLARGTQSKVNCALVSAGQLNCTSSSGQQFSLTRRSPQVGLETLFFCSKQVRQQGGNTLGCWCVLSYLLDARNIG